MTTMAYEQLELDLSEGIVEKLLEEEDFNDFIEEDAEGSFETKGYLSDWNLVTS